MRKVQKVTDPVEAAERAALLAALAANSTALAAAGPTSFHLRRVSDRLSRQLADIQARRPPVGPACRKCGQAGAATEWRLDRMERRCTTYGTLTQREKPQPTARVSWGQQGMAAPDGARSAAGEGGVGLGEGRYSATCRMFQASPESPGLVR